MSSHDEEMPAAVPFRTFSFGGWTDYREWAENDFRPRPPEEGAPPDPSQWIDPVDLPAPRLAEDLEDDFQPVVRPYVRTGGRSRPEFDLRLETLLSATAPGNPALVAYPRLNPDLLAIQQLCSGAPQSVAEISANLSMALGVARVLICDAINAGILVMHEGAPMIDGRPSIDLMARVCAGLRRLA